MLPNFLRDGAISSLNCTIRCMSKNSDAERDTRIDQEVLVDTYGEEEVMTAWDVYLSDNITVPFDAECIARCEISPLKKGEAVNVLRMAEDNDLRKEVLVIINWRGSKLGVPLSQLKPIKADKKTEQAIQDWQYWSRKYH